MAKALPRRASAFLPLSYSHKVQAQAHLPRIKFHILHREMLESLPTHLHGTSSFLQFLQAAAALAGNCPKHCMQKINQKHQQHFSGIRPRALKMLQDNTWPGPTGSSEIQFCCPRISCHPLMCRASSARLPPTHWAIFGLNVSVPLAVGVCLCGIA